MKFDILGWYVNTMRSAHQEYKANGASLEKQGFTAIAADVYFEAMLAAKEADEAVRVLRSRTGARQ